MHKEAWRHLLHRLPKTHKYTYGHVLILGGSEAMTGAPVLAARAALRAGAGLVTIASSADTIKLIDRDVEEPMTLPLPPWTEPKYVLKEIEAFIKARQVSAVVIGPGLPKDAHALIQLLIPNLQPPVVVDAEALSALGEDLSVLKTATKVNKSVILTPHLGEYTKLIAGEPQYSVNQPSDLQRFAQDYAITLILKQHHTLVIDSAGSLYKNSTGNPGLATAGAGDVLAGIIGGIVAQGITPSSAAQMAVYLHGLAGDLAVKQTTEPGLTASDIIEALPRALQHIERQIN